MPTKNEFIFYSGLRAGYTGITVVCEATINEMTDLKVQKHYYTIQKINKKIKNDIKKFLLNNKI